MDKLLHVPEFTFFWPLLVLSWKWEVVWERFDLKRLRGHFLRFSIMMFLIANMGMKFLFIAGIALRDIIIIMLTAAAISYIFGTLFYWFWTKRDRADSDLIPFINGMCLSVVGLASGMFYGSIFSIFLAHLVVALLG